MPRRQLKGIGSGVIIDESGLILTNNHVVTGSDNIMVKLSDGREFRVTDVRTDPKTDLAVLKIEATNLTDRTWAMELRDRVPFSEQENLEITYSADPPPDQRTVDGQRGILQWNVQLAPEATFMATTGYRMIWPEGQIVR